MKALSLIAFGALLLAVCATARAVYPTTLNKAESLARQCGTPTHWIEPVGSQYLAVCGDAKGNELFTADMAR